MLYALHKQTNNGNAAVQAAIFNIKTTRRRFNVLDVEFQLRNSSRRMGDTYLSATKDGLLGFLRRKQERGRISPDAFRPKDCRIVSQSTVVVGVPQRVIEPGERNTSRPMYTGGIIQDDCCAQAACCRQSEGLTYVGEMRDL